MRREGYTGTTSRGRKVTVWFSSNFCGEHFQAIAASDKISTGYFYIKKQQRWKPALPDVDYEWTPVVIEMYKAFLDDIVAGEVDD